jgi:hypothetical protein
LCPEGELKARKNNKLVGMRLGLMTPQQPIDVNVVDLTSFFPKQDASFSGSDQDSTTCCSSPEPESCIAPSASDEEMLLSSVMGCLGLDSPEVGSAQKTIEPMFQSPLTPQAFPTGPKAPPNTPSHGSQAHAAGNCKPCAWFWKPSGCQNSQECRYCHICNESELKARKKTKHAAMRLGLVTPKMTQASTHEARYALNLAACI